MEIVTVDKCSESEYVPFDEHQKLKEKYEKLQIVHENMKKSFELLEKTISFTLDLVKRQNAMEEIKEMETSIGEMQKRMLRKQENELKNTKKRSEKREKKKKEGSLCEEKMLDVAETTTNEDQVQLLKQGNSQEDAADMTKKRKRKRDSNTLKESNGEESTLMSKEESLVAVVTVEQGESRDVELNENVVQAHIPETKKRKKKKTKATKICDPLESVQDVESTKKENEDKTGELELSVLGGEDVETNESEMKESNAEESTLMSREESLVDGLTVEQVENGAIKLNENVVEAQIPKTQRRKKKKTKATKICDPLESVQVVEPTKKEKEDKTGELEQSVMGGEDVETKESEMKESNAEESTLMSKEESLVDGLTVEQGESRDVKLNENIGQTQIRETKKRKKKKTKATKICDPLESVQDVETTKNENEDKTGELEHSVWGGEDVKTKESEMNLISLDHKVESMEKDNAVQVVAMSEIGDVPRRCSCEGARKLIIFDLNGILADVAQGFTGQFLPDGKVSLRSIFKRPFVSSFLDFCFDRFDVAIWSSRRVGLNQMINIVMGDHGRNLVLCFDQKKCITTKYKTLEKKDKPLFLKDLRQVWDSFGRCNNCGNRRYDETNTLLVDDSPDKALSNPPHTAIFPYPYKYTDLEDSALGPEGELRKYLERLADAKNVQEFVEENPFGQPAITETHLSWDFYSMVVEEYK